MNKRVLFLLKYTFFWVVLFALNRLIFEIYNFSYTSQLKVPEIIGSFLHGFRLDLSMTGYFILAIGVLLSLTTVIDSKYLKYPIDYLTYLLFSVVMMITVVDIELYRNWGFRMDTTPLHYLKTPKEAMASTPLWLTLALIGFWLTASLTICYLYNRLVSADIINFKKGKWFHLPLIILITGLYIAPIRGTITVAPINAGTVYFSSNQYANHAAVNVTWNFVYALTKIKSSEQNLQLIDMKRAKATFEHMKCINDTTEKVLNTENPNVIIIVMESFTSDAIEAFGGIKGITPNMNKFASEGIAFKNIYSASIRSDKGLVSVLSGYPPQVGVSIMNFPNKTRNLTSLAQNLNQLGYSSAYYYGGDANFANMKSYLLNADFQKVEDMSSLPSTLERNSKWGIHDHLMLGHLMQEIDQAKDRFFKVLFTLSSHEPFEVPMQTVIKGEDEDSKFLNSMHYTDQAIGAFIETAKTKSWWKNTLVILVADHSVRHIYNRELHLPRRYAIPMIWLGGALSKTGVEINKIGSQQDIAATLLGQLNVDHSNYLFSKDLLAKNTHQYAFYTWGNGFGYKNEKGATAFSTDTKEFIWQEGDTTNLNTEVKSLFQIYSEDYNNKERQHK